MTKKSMKAAAFTTAAVGTGVYLAGRAFASPPYRGPVTDHFDGDVFHNPERLPHGVGGVLRWILTRDKGAWPRWIDSEPAPPPPERSESPRITFINHSTVLIQVSGTNILTDPIWSERTSPVPFAGPKRHRAPGIRFEDLPPIDVVVISHNHYDHLDTPTLRRLVARDAPRIHTPLGNAALLRRERIDGATDLDWWQSDAVNDHVTLHCVPAQHFSGRGFGDRDKTLWCGWVVDSPHGNVYFAGDTGFGEHFAEIARRFDGIRLALLPIGAFRPLWFMSPVHISPAEAVRAHKALGATNSMAIHFGCFALGDDGYEEPVIELARVAREAGLADGEFIALEEGRALELQRRADS